MATEHPTYNTEYELALRAEIAALRVVVTQAERLTRIYVIPACATVGLPATLIEAEDLLRQIECTNKVYPA